MHWNIEDLKEKLSQVNERIKYEKNEKILLTLRVDSEILNEMINYISSDRIIETDTKYYDSLILRSNINHTGEFLVSNHENLSNLSRSLSYFSKLPSNIFDGKGINDSEYFDIVDGFFKSFDSEHSALYRKMVDTNRIELNAKEYSFGGKGIAHQLNTFQSTYVASRYDGKSGIASTLPHEVGHARQLIGVSDIDIDVNLSYSLFREAYPKFIEYAFNDYLKATKYRKHAFSQEFSMLDEFIAYFDYKCPCYSKLEDCEYYDHSFHFNDGTECSINVYRYLYSSIYAIHFINMYRQNKVKCMNELNIFNDLAGRVSDEELISRYSNESLVNSVREVGSNYIRTYRRR